VSASIEDLIGYSPEQVMGSHYRLWLPRPLHQRANEAFDQIMSLPQGRVTQERIRLHTAGNEEIGVEVSARSYDTPEGKRRVVGILRRASDRRHVSTSPLRRRPLNNEREQLRERLSRPAAAEHPQHAVERSLHQLLARLDESAGTHPAALEKPLDEAIQRVTRVVESALAQTPEASTQLQWLETRKVMRSVHDQFSSEQRGSEIDLQIDLTDAPPLVWAEEAVLETSIASLLDWAAECSPPESMDGPTRAIRVIVDTRTDDGTTADPISDHVAFVIRPERVPRKESNLSRLALTIATDAAEALGGRLRTGDGGARQIEIPQPTQSAHVA
jgi:PAS domain S-box-containing protein